MSYRRATGRPLIVPRHAKTLRDVIRKHLRKERATIKELATFWDMSVNSAYRLMYKRERPMAPQHVAAVIEALQLDAGEAAELYLLGAIEAGWPLQPPAA